MATKDVCSECYKIPTNKFLDSKSLPVWYNKDGKVMYRVPPCLKKLRLGEKMLIQRAKLFIPLIHLKNGIMGLKGHTCAFPQNVHEVADKLPRLPNDVTIIRVILNTQAEIGSKEKLDKPFIVRKQAVLDALYFLKDHNEEYKRIEIMKENLNCWMGEKDEMLMHTIVKEVKEMPTQDEMDNGDDKGPAEKQTKADEKENDISNIGVISENEIPVLHEDDNKLEENLRSFLKNSTTKNMVTEPFPTIGKNPINEYDKSQRIFCMAFPWLFPGGIGDPTDYCKQTKDWGKHMLLFEDGRFARDDLFCFFAENYEVRHLNSDTGHFFVNGFHKGDASTLPELQENIRKGDLKFINNLSYYAQKVKGSNEYWRQKRGEIYSWIAHHAEVGNGAPMLFITLSCAEYYWPDI